MSSGCAHPVDHCMCVHRVDHWMCAPSGPLDVCICITTTCRHPRAHRKRYIRWSTRCSYIWWTTSSPLVVIRMQRHLVDHWMWRSPVYALKAQPVRCAGLTVTMDAHLLDNVPWRLTSRTTKLRFTADGCSVFLFSSKIDGECTELSSHLSLLSCLLMS